MKDVVLSSFIECSQRLTNVSENSYTTRPQWYWIERLSSPLHKWYLHHLMHCFLCNCNLLHSRLSFPMPCRTRLMSAESLSCHNNVLAVCISNMYTICFVQKHCIVQLMTWLRGCDVPMHKQYLYFGFHKNGLDTQE